MGAKITDVRKYIESSSIPIPWTGCWIWLKHHAPTGYGIAFDMKKGLRWSAHRLSYAAFHGEIPEGRSILHKCDVRCCVNPNHLYAGTQQDNVDDAVRRGRMSREPKTKPLDFCKRGHPTPPGSRISNRTCPECVKDIIKRCIAKKKGIIWPSP